MSVITYKDRERPRAARSAVEPDRYFARTEATPGAWRRTLALAKRFYGPLIVYTALAVATIAAMAIRVAIWVPL